jgi:hypothetical protein
MVIAQEPVQALRSLRGFGREPDQPLGVLVLLFPERVDHGVDVGGHDHSISRPYR